MIMVQKQPNFPFNHAPVTLNHRRHPSAPPAVVVQPTKTPGLLSLSKPIQRPSRPNSTQRSMPKLQVHVGIAPVSPSPNPLGRQTKDKTRSAPRSHSLSGRRQTHRQPSPPLQAEGPLTPTKSSHVSNPNSDPFISSIPSPTFATHPSGKLARKRQPQLQQHNSKSTQPLPIPTIDFKQSSKPVSRSVPLPPHRPAKRSVHINTNSLLPPFDFPVCDDMTDAGDLSDVDHAPLSPVTPTRPRAPFKNKIRTLPKNPPTSPPVTNKGRPNRNHKRAPSDSGMVFNMSSDESGPEGSSTSDEELRALVRNMAAVRTGMRTPQPAQKEWSYERHTRKEVQGYFASSLFQNSPSPDELPDPLFV